jgi:glutathione synthase/RimK-type ligase-like ATP-grasp enzyme
MKKILILTRFRGEYEPTRLKKEAVALGYVADVVNYEQVRIGVEQDGNPEIDLGTGKLLEEYNLVIPRAASARGKISMTGVKTVILEYLEKYDGGKICMDSRLRGNDLIVGWDCHVSTLAMTRKDEEEKVKVLNGRSFKAFPMLGKMEQGILLSQVGLPAIPFQSFNGKKGWKSFLGSDPKLPVMVKMRFGSHGKGVRLAETRGKLEKLSHKYAEGTVLIQPVLKVRRWYRVIVLEGKVLGMMAHRQKGKFQTEEISEKVKDVKPEFSEMQFDELKSICLGACELFECDFAGLDVAWEEDQKRWIIFEINRTAQFKWFEKAHPEINVGKSMLTFDKMK